MPGSRLLVRLPGRSAEDAVRVAGTTVGVGGFAVGADLMAGPGPAVVGAVSRVGRVLVLWAVHGAASDVAAACSRMAEYGASWVAVHASAGAAALEAGVGAVAGSDTAVAAWALDPALDDTAVTGLGLGRSRGRVVSRLTAAARDAGVSTILCAPADLGVVAQVAPVMERIVVGAPAPSDVEAALGRGADFVVVEASAVAI